MRSQTAISAVRLAAILLAALSGSCARFSNVEKNYRNALSAYRSGDLPKAVDQAARNATRWQKDPNSRWFWSFRLLEAEALIAQSQSAQALNLLKDPVPQRPELEQLEARRLIDMVSLTSTSKAVAVWQSAHALTKDPELLIRLKIAEGNIANRTRRFEDAAKAFSDAEKMADQQQNLYWQAQALSNWSVSVKSLGRDEEAIDLGLRALEIAERAGARRVAAQAHGNLSSPLANIGDFESASKHHKQAIQIFEAIGAKRDLMISLGELGVWYDRQVRPQEAIPNYRQAYKTAVELKADQDAQRFAENLALAFMKTEQWADAAEWNERASELASGGENSAPRPSLERNRAIIARHRGDSAEAVRICEKLLQTDLKPDIAWTIYDLLGEIDAEKGNFSKANQEFQKALTIIDERTEELSERNNRIMLLSRLIPFYREYVGALAEQNDNAGALRVVESSRARVLAERLGRKSGREQSADLASLQRFAASTKSSILSFWFGPRRSFAWLITSKGPQRFQLPPVAQVEKLVTAYREVVEHSLSDPITSKDASGTELWNALMAKIDPLIPKGSRVIVIPDGPLHRLNIETLVVPSPTPHYWIEDVELAVAPSTAILMSQPPPELPRAKSILLIGAPDYTGTRYEPLKGAEREILDIQAKFPGTNSDMRSGAAATPNSYREGHPEGFKLIHLAAHAEANEERPLESFVVLSHQAEVYKLYARDVIQIPIHADLVTLSACHSAGTRAYAGEGLMGFAWAFLHAGARSVVAGLWAASDESTALLMDRFYAGIAAGQDSVTALRNAKRSLLAGDARYRKPFYWAPFQVYLGSASRSAASQPSASRSAGP